MGNNIFFNDTQAFIYTICSSFVTYKIARMTLFPKINIPILEKQLYEVYLPLFKIFNTKLFEPRTIREIETMLPVIKEIIASHYELIDPNIICCYDSCISFSEKLKNGETIAPDCYQQLNNEKMLYLNFQEIEIIVSTKFDYIRAKLGLPTRSFKFKVSKNQLTPVIKSILALIMKIILVITMLLLSFLIIGSVTKMADFIYHNIQSFVH